MGGAGPVEGERHFSGFNTRLVVQYLERRHPPGTLAEVLRRAGEDRSAAELADESTWSSYDQFRRLLEATAEVVGFDALHRIAPSAELLAAGSGESAVPLQELGSPGVLLQEAHESGTTMGMSAIVVSVGGGQVGPQEFVTETRFVDGFAPFRAWCAYSAGLLTVVPTLFGLPVGEAVEEACACDGAPHCRTRLRWASSDEPEAVVGELRARLAALQSRLDSFEETVADVVSGGDVAVTLARVAASAARTLRTPAHALVLDDEDLAAPLVVGRAPGPTVAEVRAADPTCTTDLLVVPVGSGRQAFGRLAVIEPGRRFRPHERGVLLSYARQAAAALETASALVDSRRQAGTARALLHLSNTLGQVLTSDEMAAELARALPAVVDCDRAVVVLADSQAGAARIAAVHGYPDDLAARMLGTPMPLDDLVASGGEVEYLQLADLDPDHPAAGIMAASGSAAAAIVPILVEGAVVGQVVAAVKDRPERLARTPDFEERLRGIAAQGSAAIRNGLLVDAIRHQALHDALTHLPNRVLILDRLGQLVKQGRRRRRPVGVLFIDLDGFKDVNDTLGHEAGDRLLCAVADRLTGAVREGDTVGRLGGDEFVVLIGDTTEDGRSPEAVAERVLAQLAPPFVLEDGRSLVVTASIGIALGDAGPGDLLRDADVALYEAKAAGKGRALRYAADMGAQANRRLALEVDLQAALAGDQLFLVYQPIVDLARGEVTGVEALLRWRHPERGVVVPGEFVHLLEETGLIMPVGAWVLRQACAQAARWAAEGHPLDIAVNVSPRQLEAPSLVEVVSAALAESGLSPRRLVVEVTEGELMRQPEAAAERLRRLRALGVRVAIDDFGTGYSSLIAVRDFPVDILKIDRTFVDALERSPRNRSLVHLFVQLGRELALSTVAEGVEAASQLVHLRGEHCDLAQGFYFSHPLPAEEMTAVLTGHPLPS